MPKHPLDPERQCRLEAYVTCLRRAEKRIIFAHRIATGQPYAPDFAMRNWRNHQHQVAAIRRSGLAPYAEALMHLRLARSKFQAELDGLEW